MSGHSKWANTKHRKAYKDAKKSKLFNKLIKELVSASNIGGPDPKKNNKLRQIINKALLNNIPKDTIKRSIERGTLLYKDKKPLTNDKIYNFKNDKFYSTFGKQGEFILLHVDNRINIIYINNIILKNYNRQVYLFKEDYMPSFSKKYYSLLCDMKDFSDKDIVVDILLNNNIEDICWINEYIIKIVFEPKYFNTIQNILLQKEIKLLEHNLFFIPINRIYLNDRLKEKFLDILSFLRENINIKNISHNIIL